MEFRFQIEKSIAASVSNVIANYLDIQHVGFHSNLKSINVISEGHNSALFELHTKLLCFPMRTLSYFEYRSPNVIFQFNKSVFYELEITSAVKDVSTSEQHRSLVLVDIKMRTSFFLFLLKPLIISLARRENRKILDEDLKILTRRDRLFGSFVDDYITEENKVLFKAEFAKCFRGVHAGR